jgi:MFS family permease
VTPSGNGPKSSSLLRHRDFVHLWGAETVSQLGSQISLIAFPLIAITLLDATTLQVGLLTAIEFSPFVLIGLPAGALVDRLPRRPVLMWCDIGRAIALLSIPIAYWLDVLTYGQLCVVVFLTGSMTVFFDVAYQSYLPALVGRDQLADGNSKLEVSRSAAAIAGPGIGGLLIEAIGAAAATFADAVSFLVSAVFLRGIKTVEPPVAAADREVHPLRRLGREIKEGLRYVLGHRVLRLIAGCTATGNFFMNVLMAVFLLYAVRELDYSAGAVGLIYTLGNVGTITAAVVATRITRRLRLGPAIIFGNLLLTFSMLLIPLAPSDLALPFFIAGWIGFGFGSTLYNIDQVSLRQAITPHDMLGRMNASMRFMVWGTMPFGSLAGGVLGTLIGLQETLWVGAIGGLLSIPWVLAKPVRELRAIPSAIG